MKILILSPLWGHEHMPLNLFLDKIRIAGFDGIDTWIPENADDKNILFDYLQRHEMPIVTHQHRAQGNTFAEFKQSFLQNLYECAEPSPVLINSHTGRDWFTLEQNLELLDIAQNFSDKTGIKVAHETHRGRMGYSPQTTAELMQRNKHYQITADLSHWTCVTESLLQNFGNVLDIALPRTLHIHARIGYENGPQVPDPRAPEWAYVQEAFLCWWDRIVEYNRNEGHETLTFTTEFGPPPYMLTVPFSNTPVASQFEINCYMKDLLRARYAG